MRSGAVALLIGLTVVSGASARYPGSPLLDTAAPGAKKAVSATATVSAAFDGSVYLGARGGYNVTDRVRLFAGLGYTEALAHGLSIVSSDIAATVAEAGVTWSLPLDLPVDLAARACAFRAFVPSKTYTASLHDSATMHSTLKMKASGAAAQLVGSKEAIEDLHVYGGLGIHFLVAEADLGYTLRPDYRDRPSPVEPGGVRYERGSHLDLGLAGGATYRVARNADAIAEWSYVRGAALALGIRVMF